MNRYILKVFWILLLLVRACSTHPNDISRSVDKQEDAAIAEIRRLGGRVTFDDDAPGKPLYGVDLSETRIVDDDLATVAKLTQLKALVLNQTKVTDAGLKRIKGLVQLHSLLLDDTRVTDA